MAEELGFAIFRLGFDDSEFVKGLQKSKAAAEQAGEAMAKAVDEKASKAQEKALKDLEKRIDKFALGATAAFGALGVISAKAAIDFESSFAGVRKTVDATDAEFRQLSGAFRQMAKEIPVNVNEINRIGEAAGQLGIQTEHLVDFTRVMADLGVATNMSSDEAATALARLANITQMNQTEFDRLGSTVVALGNNFATTEREIVEMGLRLAGAGAQIGLTEAQILGLAAALSSVGIEAEAGGSAMSRVMMEINKQVETGGDKLALFAEVAGMSAQQFADAWRTDPAAALVAFITGLGNMESQGKSALLVLEDLEITEIRMRDALLRSAGAGELMADALGLATTAWEENTALTKEAEERYKTTASQIQIAKNTVQDAAISLGQELTPAIRLSADMVGGLASAFASLPQSTQNLILLSGAAMAVAPLLVRVGENALAAGRAMMTLGQQSLRVKAALGVGGVATAIIAIDGALQLFGGKSIFDILFGSRGDDRAERVAKALEEYNNELRYSAGNVSEFEVQQRRLNEALAELGSRVPEYNESMERMVGLRREDIEAVRDGTATYEQYSNVFNGLLEMAERGNHVGQEFARVWRKSEKDVIPAIQAMGQAAKDSGMSLGQMLPLIRSLPEPLRDIYLEAAGAKEAFYQIGAPETIENIEALAWGTADVATQVSNLNQAIGPMPSLLDEIEIGGRAWGETLVYIGSQLDEVSQKKLRNLVNEIDMVGVSADELASLLEQRVGEDAAQAFEDFREAARENYETQLELIASLLPQIGEKFDEWKKRLQGIAEAHANFRTNLTTIYEHITSAGVQMPEQILAAVAQQGPLFAQNFAQYFAEDPQGALENLKLIAPILMGETGDQIIEEILGLAPGVDHALQVGIEDPWEQTWESTKTSAETGAKETGEAAVAGTETGLSGLPSVLDRDWRDVVLGGVDLSEDVRPGAEATGEAMAGGIKQGIENRANELLTAAANLAARVLAQFKIDLQIRSPSRVMADEVGLPIAQGIAVGMEEGAPLVRAAGVGLVSELYDAMSSAALKSDNPLERALSAFTLSLTEGRIRAEWEDAFGSLGASALDALTKALTGDTGAASRLAGIVEDLIDEAREAGVPNAEELGQALIDAISRGLIDGSDAAIQAAIDALGDLTDAIGEAVKVGADTLGDAIDEILAERAYAERLGRYGVGLMNAFYEAISEGTKRAVRKLGEAAIDIRDELTEALPPAQAAFLGSKFMEALNNAIEDGTEENIAILENWLEIINRVLEGGAYDIRTGTLVIAEDIDRLGEALGVSAETIINNIGAIIDAGLLGMLDSLEDLPDAVRKTIAEILDLLEKGKIDIGDAVSDIEDVLDGGSGNKGPVDSGGVVTKGQPYISKINEPLDDKRVQEILDAGATYIVQRVSPSAPVPDRPGTGYNDRVQYPMYGVGGIPGGTAIYTWDPYRRMWVGSYSTAMLPEKRASGGPVLAGRPYIVGELGPELVVPRTSGTVIPNHALQGVQLGNSYEFNVQVTIEGNADADTIHEAMWSWWEEAKEHEFGLGAVQAGVRGVV